MNDQRAWRKISAHEGKKRPSTAKTIDDRRINIQQKNCWSERIKQRSLSEKTKEQNGKQKSERDRLYPKE